MLKYHTYFSEVIATTEAMLKVEREVYQLPKGFLDYIESKITNRKKRGRPHTIQRLGTLENVLEVLNNLWLEGKSLKEESQRLQVNHSTVCHLTKDLDIYKDQIINYLKYVEGYIPKAFRSYDSIRNWEMQIRLSGHLSSLSHIRMLERICTGQMLKEFKCTPDRFNLEKAKEFVSKYLIKHKKTKLPYHLRMALRHFLASKSIIIPRGFGGQYGLSGEKESYGKYSHIKLSEDHIMHIQNIMANSNIALQNGYDIAFNIGLQTCSRAFAIGSLNVNRISKENNLYRIEVFESKIKGDDEYLGYRGKWWTKYITESVYDRIEQFIKDHPKRSLLFIDIPKKTHVRYFLGFSNLQNLSFRSYLKQVYREIGIKEPYFYNHPIHSLRHAGAHRLLKKTNYNYDLVARLGGWTDTKTLKECYGEMPEEIIINILRNL